MNKTASVAAKLTLFGLVGVVVSSMMGSGVFSLPQNMAAGASVDAIVIAWIITGIGMYFVSETFRLLSTLKPNMTSGIYSYAQEGFGRSAGFFVGWGYWLSNVFANTGLAVILMESLNYFFAPHFKGGNNLNSFLLSTVIIWSFFLLISKGIKAAAAVNLIGTIFKLIPLLLFILITIAAFRFDVLKADLFDNLTFANFNIANLMGQIKSTMLVTLWAFIGIEAAVVLSDRAKKQSDVAKATLIGFVMALCCYMLISIVPFGIISRDEIASFSNPSTAGVLARVIGPAGGLLMTLGLIVSVLFSWLSWVIIASEVPFTAAKGGTFPKQFAKENEHGTPVFSVLTTTLAMQLALLIAFYSADAWNTMLSITAVMILPVYLVTAMFLCKISSKKRFPRGFGIPRGKAVITSVLGVIYSVWLIYAANLKYLLMAVIFFSIGIPVLMTAKRQAKRAVLAGENKEEVTEQV